MDADGTKRLTLIKSLEAICESLIEQSSRWEAQALEAGVRIAELEELFALQQTRMAEAVEAWRKATGKHDTLPDLGDLLAWLMVRPAALEAQVRELREAAEKAIRLINELGSSPLELAAKYGPDYESPTQGELIDMRDFIEAALVEAQEGKEERRG